MEKDLKTKTASTIKWNVIDRFCSQILYAVTGIVLARILSQEDFGLVGAILVFQAFALILINSGFSFALFQRKAPTRLDYSSVLWFNLAISILLYIILWFCAPWIASLFGGDPRLIPLSRAMFVTLILNASAIVQTNRFLKQMNAKMVALANNMGLIAGSVVAIILSLEGFGPWAIVWQSITLGIVNSLILWFTSHWTPLLKFSWAALKSYTPVGMSMLGSAFLNTLFQNIYGFFIGNRVGLVSLGYYTQSDKWSKMGMTSITQVLSSSFLPALSAVQDDPERFVGACSKMNRFTSYISLPAMGFLIVMATPIFHLLFGTKWDPSIILFQLLLVKGIFFIFTTLYHNYIIAKGRSKLIFNMELLKDVVAFVALIITLPYIALTTPDDIVYGIKILLWGQIAASAVAWAGMMISALKVTGASLWGWIKDILPYLAETLAIMVVLYLESIFITSNALVILVVQTITACVLYFGINAVLGSVIQKEAILFLKGKKKSL